MAQMPGVGCSTHTPRRALEKAHHPHISFGCILLVRIGPLPRQAACLGMETLDLSQKWAEVGGATLDAVNSPSLPAHCREGSAPQAERFLQEKRLTGICQDKLSQLRLKQRRARGEEQSLSGSPASSDAHRAQHGADALSRGTNQNSREGKALAGATSEGETLLSDYSKRNHRVDSRPLKTLSFLKAVEDAQRGPLHFSLSRPGCQVGCAWAERLPHVKDLSQALSGEARLHFLLKGFPQKQCLYALSWRAWSQTRTKKTAL